MRFLLTFLILACLTAGCGTNRFWNDMFERDVVTLESAKNTGISKEVALTKDEAFKKTLEVVNSAGLKVFRERPKDNYIIVIGFPKQTNTTQVGIFFDGAGDTAKVTVTSLSSTALKKADEMILQNL